MLSGVVKRAGDAAMAIPDESELINASPVTYVAVVKKRPIIRTSLDKTKVFLLQ